MSISPKNEASQNNTVKRRDYISWDEYFMGIAMLSAMRSKDPNSQVGACIVRDNKILSLGYNGMPIGCDDDIMPWGREGNELETKYMYVCHSELNAILNAGKDLHGSTMYVTLFPCNECAKAIIQSGIKRIVYLDDKYRDANNNVAVRQAMQDKKGSAIWFHQSGSDSEIHGRYYGYQYFEVWDACAEKEAKRMATMIAEKIQTVVSTT